MVEEEDRDAAAEEAPKPLARDLAEIVRRQSREEGKLTPASSLEVEGVPLSAEQQAALLQEMLADEQCGDVRLLRSSKGTAYLYSSDHVSDTYARILMRVEENNPYETIASIVREESEIYPRPTPVKLFREPTFGLDPERVERLVEEMVQLAQYRDVKPIRASTGALYLYSDRHLDGEWAGSLVEWEEVGRRQNP